jgi:predicted hydrocarbon binding protein
MGETLTEDEEREIEECARTRYTRPGDIPRLLAALRAERARAEALQAALTKTQHEHGRAEARADRAEALAKAERDLRLLVSGWDGPCGEHTDDRDGSCPACHVDADIDAAADALRAAGGAP